VKIGISDDPDRRLRQLQTGYPRELVINHREPVEHAHQARMFERFIHDQLGHCRLTGEWFSLDVEAAIAEVQFAIIRWAGDPMLEKQYRGRLRR
jgi:hypothetical protein